MYRLEFTVRGFGQFPFDMLRYDHCYPKSESEVWVMVEGHYAGEPKVMTLVMVGTTKDLTPTPARWRSFGWEVQSIGIPQRIK